MPTSLSLDTFSTQTSGDLNISGGNVTASYGEDFWNYGGNLNVTGSTLSSLGAVAGTPSYEGVLLTGGQGMSIANSAITSDSGVLIEGDGDYGWNSGLPAQFTQNDTGLTVTNTKIIDEQPSSSNWIVGVVELGSYYKDAGINIDANSSINSTGACEECTIIIGSSLPILRHQPRLQPRLRPRLHRKPLPSRSRQWISWSARTPKWSSPGGGMICSRRA